MTEGQLQAAVVELCDRLGLLCFHDNDSRRNRAGLPDLIIVGSSVLFVELKSEDGRVSPEQRIWISALENAGVDVVVWRPSHLQDKTIQAYLARMTGQKPGREMMRMKALRATQRAARPTSHGRPGR